MVQTALGRWLQRQLEIRQLSQMAAAAQAGVGVGTLSDILRRGHIPKVETLFRLADFFDTPRGELLRLAAEEPPAPDEAEAEEEALIRELVQEFRQVPDAWKREVLAQVALFARLARRPPWRIIGDEEEEKDEPIASDQDAAA